MMRDRSLTPILVADALSGAIFFIACVEFTEIVSGLTGLPSAIVVPAGWICLAAAFTFGFLAVKPVRSLLAMAVFANAAWVLASLVVLVACFGQLSATGIALIVLQAVVVEYFTWREWQGLRRLGADRPAVA